LFFINFEVNAMNNYKVDVPNDIAVNENYSLNRVIISLNNSESLLWNDYSANDFPNISIKNITDLTSSYKNKLHTFTLEKKNEFKRILQIDLNESSISNLNFVIEKLSEYSFIEAISPDYNLQISKKENTEAVMIRSGNYVEQQWGLQTIDYFNARTISDYQDSEMVKVGVVDSGIAHREGASPEITDDYNEDLVGKINIVDSISYADPDTDPFVCAPDNHGTLIAGIIGARSNNAIGINGICSRSYISSIRIDPSVEVQGENHIIENYISRTCQAINFATERNIKILNMSFGSQHYSPLLRNTINNFNGLIICGAGNSYTNNDVNPFYPASYDCDNIISVGAINQSGDIWYSTEDENGQNEIQGSNYGTNSVDIFAPGVDIISTGAGNTYIYATGTSFAAPFVTGVAAMIYSLIPEGTTMTNIDVKNLILDSVTLDSDFTYLCTSGGILNAYKCLQYFHNHTYQYQQYSSTEHIAACSCGYQKYEAHFWIFSQMKAIDIIGGRKTCSKCGLVSLGGL